MGSEPLVVNSSFRRAVDGIEFGLSNSCVKIVKGYQDELRETR